MDGEGKDSQRHQHRLAELRALHRKEQEQLDLLRQELQQIEEEAAAEKEEVVDELQAHSSALLFLSQPQQHHGEKEKEEEEEEQQQHGVASVRALTVLTATLVRRYDLAGSCHGDDCLVFRVVFDVTADEQQHRFVITRMTARVSATAADTSLHSFVRSCERRCALLLLLRGLAQYSRHVKQRTAVLARLHGSGMSLSASPNQSVILLRHQVIKDADEQERMSLVLHWRLEINHANGVTEEKIRVLPKILASTASAYQQRVVQQLETQFAELLGVFGVERAVAMLMDATRL